MKSSVFAAWISRRPFRAYILLPAAFSLLMIALYYCGIYAVQSFVAPQPDTAIGGWRGFGALSLLQVFVLLCVMFYLLRGLSLADTLFVRLMLVAITIAVLFMLLEELDHGSRLMGLISGAPAGGSPGAWDLGPSADTQASGDRVAGYLKLAGNVLVLVAFVVLPLTIGDSRSRTLRLLAPSKWTIATVAVAIGVTWLVLQLDNAGFGIINDRQGALHFRLSEFREACVYYLLLMYVAVLHERLVHRRNQ